MSMQRPAFKVGDRVKMVPDSGWRGVIIARHPHRNNGLKVRTTQPHGAWCSDEFWVRPISIEEDVDGN